MNEWAYSLFSWPRPLCLIICILSQENAKYSSFFTHELKKILAKNGLYSERITSVLSQHRTLTEKILLKIYLNMTYEDSLFFIEHVAVSRIFFIVHIIKLMRFISTIYTSWIQNSFHKIRDNYFIFILFDKTADHIIWLYDSEKFNFDDGSSFTIIYTLSK